MPNGTLPDWEDFIPERADPTRNFPGTEMHPTPTAITYEVALEGPFLGGAKKFDFCQESNIWQFWGVSSDN